MNVACAFPRLFSKGKIGSIEISNRVVMLPLGTALSSDTGAVTQEFTDYYAERAKGGVGLVIVEATLVDDPIGRIGPTQITIDGYRFIAGLEELTDAVHRFGSRIFVQLHHGGRQTTPELTGGQPPLAPSAVGCKVCGSQPRAMTINEIAWTVEKFVQGAKRAQTAGFDGVELHGAHGYLINQFMSPHTNRRTDEFGGSLENRMRFPLLIVKGIRDALGRFPISFRISVDEMIPGGITLDEGILMAKMLEEAGVDVLNVTSGIYESMAGFIEPSNKGEAWRAYLAAATKSAVKIPVITAGVIRDPRTAENVLAEGKADFVGIGRALVADPEWPAKAKANRVDEIRKCISCNSCFSRISNGLHIRCSVNARAGREARTAIAPAHRQKRVWVIGAGPAGMEAARVAKAKGHDVTLYEREEKVGGQLNMAMVPPGKEKINWLRSWLIGEIERLGVSVVCGREIKPTDVVADLPDVVVVATGAQPLIPQIPGTGLSHVVTAWNVLAGKVEILGEQVVVAGGGMVGCETALFLSGLSNKVTVVEMLPQVAGDVEPITRGVLLDELSSRGIRIRTSTTVLEITREGVRVQERPGSTCLIPADRVVLALGARSNWHEEEWPADLPTAVYVIGDSRKPGKIIHAINDGFLTGQAI